MINYFILNTSQFLNAFSNVSEKKIHDVDEKLDRLETMIALFEAKMESLPEEHFEHEAPEDGEEEIEGLGQTAAAAPLAMTDQM